LEVRLSILEVRLSILEVRLSILKVRLWILEVRLPILEVRLWILENRLSILEVRLPILENRLSILEVRQGVLELRNWLVAYRYGKFFKVFCFFGFDGKAAALITPEMDKKTRSRANMHTTVTLLLDGYSDVVTADPDLTAAEQARQVHIAAERIQSRKAMEPTTPNTQVKEGQKRNFIADFMKPVGRVEAWAARTNNGDVAGQLAFTPSDLINTPDIQLTGKVENAMTVMRGVIAQVTTVATALLDDLDNRLDGLQPRLGSPRLKIVEREAAGRQAVLEIAAATKVLTQQHDKILRSYNLASPATPAEQRQRDLYDRWAAAREIVDAATFSEEPATPVTPPAPPVPA
jgi:hypothetical protein